MAFAGADELLPFFVGTFAKDGERRPSCIRRPLKRCDQSGIIQRLPRGIQKLQGMDRRASPRLPRCAPRPRRAVVQVLLQLPAFFQEHIAESLDLVHDAGPSRVRCQARSLGAARRPVV